MPNVFQIIRHHSSFITNNNGAKMAVPLKYLSNLWRSSEMPLIDCKVELSIRWYENCILSSAGTAATFAITDTKLYVPVVTLKTEGNAKLSKLLNEGFKRSIYWNKYKAILKDYADNDNMRDRLDVSFQGVNRLFVLAYARADNVTNENSFRKYVLPRLKIKNYNIEIDGRNFYDQAVNDSIKQYDEIRKISIGLGHTTSCLLEFAYFLKKYKLIAADLNKQKALDVDPEAIQQIIIAGKTDNTIRIYYVLEQSKETILEFAKGTTKVW